MTRRFGRFWSIISLSIAVAAALIVVFTRTDDDTRTLEEPSQSAGVDDDSIDDGEARRSSGVKNVAATGRRAESAESEAAERTIILTDESARPLDDHLVVVFSGLRVISSGKTDEGGRCRLSTPVEGECAIVVGKGRAPTKIATPKAGATLTVALPIGAACAGKVLIDGSSPRDPIDVQLTLERSLWQSLALPSAVRELLKRSGFAPDHSARPTDADGRFRFLGLLAGDDVMVEVRSTHLVDRESGRVAKFLTKTPNENVVIDLLSIPEITGRVVAEDDRAPIEGAQVVLSYTPKGGNAVSGLRSTTGQDGRFSIPSARGTVKFEYEVRTPGGAVVPFPSTMHVFDGNLDLGDVSIPRDRMIEVILKNDLGEPLAGGFVHWKGSTHTRSDPTDAGGKTRLTLKNGGGVLRASALGHESAESEAIAAATSAPIELVLERANRLRIRAAADFDLTKLGLSARIVCETAPVFSTTFGEPDPGQSPRSFELISFSGGNGAGVKIPLRDGKVEIGPVRRGARFLISISDDLGHELGRTVYDMPPSGDGEVIVPIQANFSRVFGDVTDADGRPLAGAVVTVQAGGSNGQYVETGDDGVFAFVGSFAAKLTLAVSAIGYLQQTAADVSVPSTEPIRFKLVPARALTVAVKDGDGVPFDRVMVTADWSGGKEIGARFGRAQYRFRGLPEGVVRFTADVFGDLSTVSHRTESGDFTITVATCGTVNVGWSSDLQSGRKVTLRADAQSPDCTSKSLPLTRTQLASGVLVALPPLLPGDYEVYLEAINPSAAGMIVISEKKDVRVLGRQTVEVLLTVK